MGSSTHAEPARAPPGRTRVFAATRWLYQKDGRDVGPCSPAEVKGLLTSGEIGPETMVRDSARHEWHRVREVWAFVEFLKEIQTEREHSRQAHEFDKAVTQHKKSTSGVWSLVGVGALVAAAVGGWIGWSQWSAWAQGAPTEIERTLIRELALPSVPAAPGLGETSPIAWAEESVHRRQARAQAPSAPGEVKETAVRRPRPAATAKGSAVESTESGEAEGGSYLPTADDLSGAAKNAPVQEFSFEDGQKVGRELESSDVGAIIAEATPKLVSCAQKEASRSPGFPGTTVSFAIVGSGRMGSARVGHNGSRSKAFVACVRSALAQVKVSPFDGQGKTVSIPLRVSQ